ncbi:MAG: B12-binding domain-containing radical SAM protein [Candidatus Omnitrophica bacterium]|nr:B12-binding domain-containing radical SAM protein [Candidatus Omnitrophota bacterium]
MTVKGIHRPVVLVSRAIAFTFPLSYAYLAGYLKEKGEPVELLFRPEDKKYGNLVRDIADKRPILVGIGGLYPELKELAGLISMIKEACPGVPVVIGGQMVTPIPELALEVTGADLAALGEGEVTLYNLVKYLREGKDLSGVRGLVFKKDGEFVHTGGEEYIEDLKDLPAIPYELFPERQWLEIGRWYARKFPQPHWRFNDRVINVHGGRGCPFTCNFCYHHSKPRFRPVELMMKEAREALLSFKGNVLYFSDETTLYSTDRVRKIIDQIKSLPYPIEYSVSSRFDILDRIDDGLLAELRTTGCRIMGLGIESGSDRVLKVIGKAFTADTVRRGLRRLKEAGILPTVSIMLGQYAETEEEAEMSIRLVRDAVRENKNIQFNFTIATPFPGSKLYEQIFSGGYMKDDKEFYDKYFRSEGHWKSVVNMSAMSDEKLSLMYDRIWKVYRIEKRKAVGWKVAVLELIMLWAGRICYKAGLADNGIYENIQICLDRSRLEARGIINGGKYARDQTG